MIKKSGGLNYVMLSSESKTSMLRGVFCLFEFFGSWGMVQKHFRVLSIRLTTFVFSGISLLYLLYVFFFIFFYIIFILVQEEKGLHKLTF